MPYEIRGKCIYRKDTGAKVGCTKGDVHKYMAALQMHAHESENKGLNEVRMLVRKTLKESFNKNILDRLFKKEKKYSIDHWDESGNKYKITGVFIYVRFGLPEKDENGNFKNSFAYFGDEKRYEEGGISVFEGLYDGKNIYVFTPGSAISSSYSELFNSSRKAYVVDGNLSNNEGTDTEILLDKDEFKVLTEVPKDILIQSR